jgi:hypothetical protein
MSSLLPATDLVSCYVLIDDISKQIVPQYVTGRPPLLSIPETTAILVYASIMLRAKTLKDVWNIISLYHKNDFKKFPSYTTFIDEVHRALPYMEQLLSQLLVKSGLNFVDSTFLEVCTRERADHYKVAKNKVAFGKNHQGWRFGFKMHTMIHESGSLSSILFTPGNMYDAQALPELVKKHMQLLIGDSHYGAKVMREYMWKEYGIAIITPPHHTQTTKTSAWWQIALLNIRSKIESVFDYLKNHMNLVSSFPRSLNGYFVHYYRILIGYQIGLLLKYVALQG